MKYDIGIVGGGIAGLSVALHASSRIDATIVIIDKGKIIDPTKSSPFTFTDVIERYDLHDAVFQSYTKYTYRSPEGFSASFEYTEPIFVTLDYEKACKNLLRQIKKEGNVDIFEGIKVSNFTTNITSGGVTLNLEDNENISVKVLVDASGRTFLAAKTLGLRLPSFYSHAYGEVLNGCEVENPEEMHILAGKKYGNGGGWFYPINIKIARYGIAIVSKSTEYPSDALKANFSEACKSFSPYNEIVSGSKTIRAEYGTIPIGSLKRFVFDRVMIVGDAAGQATPWFCEGVRPALESGEMCGKVIAKAYKRKDYSLRILNEYQRAWDSMNRIRYLTAMNRSQYQWFKNQKDWDNIVKYVSTLTPQEMLTSIRYGPNPHNKCLPLLFSHFQTFLRKLKIR